MGSASLLAVGWPSKGFGTRQQYPKSGALTYVAFNANGATETPNDPVDDRKPETVSRGFGRKEWVEQPGLCFPRDPLARIGDLELQIIALAQTSPRHVRPLWPHP